MNPEQVQIASREMNEIADCAIRAVAVSTGEDYDKVHALFVSYGRKFRGRSRWGMELRAVKDLGYEYVVEVVKSKTVLTLERELMKTRNYILRVSGHLIGINQGKIYDWAQGRQKRIVRVYWIKEKK